MLMCVVVVVIVNYTLLLTHQETLNAFYEQYINTSRCIEQSLSQYQYMYVKLFK